MKDQNICAHGYDKRFVHCNRCADPAFDAAKQPSFTVMTATIGGAQPAADTIAKPQGFPSSNEQGPLWTPTFVVERLLRQTQLSTADQITMDRKQLEGLLFDVLRCRNNHSVAGSVPETTRDALPQLEWEVTYDVVAYNASWGGYGSNASKSGFLSEEEAIAYAKPLEAHLNAVVWKSTKPKPVTPLAIKVWSAVKTPEQGPL